MNRGRSLKPTPDRLNALSETRSILEAWDVERAAGRSAVLATVVRVTGSAYRGPGARMLLRWDGTAIGLVSGGCLEADLAERARAVERSRTAHTVVYDLRSPDDVIWGLGLGCSGEIRVLLERLDPADRVPHLDLLRASLDRRASGAVAVAFSVDGTAPARVGDRWLFGPRGERIDPREDDPLSPSIAAVAERVLTERRSRVAPIASPGGTVDVLVEHLEPPLALLVFGAGGDAEPLVDLAAGLGWEVTVADPRPAYARAERFPRARRVVLVDPERAEARVPPPDERTAAVVLTHNFVHDLHLLELLLRSRAPYVGLLGPRRRAEKLMAGIEGVRLQGAIHAPVGLDIGAETPAEIALSILAEIQAHFAGRPGGSLRDRNEPLHPRRHGG
jgi:xanthine dehydrogenase accessory factor